MNKKDKALKTTEDMIKTGADGAWHGIDQCNGSANTTYN